MTRATRRSLAFLAGAVALSTLAAWWRWPDSAHAIGVVRAGGGAARHPVALRGGEEEYVVVATAKVLPPWRGDAVVSVEGTPPMRWDVELSRPVVDLGLRRWPRLEGETLRGLAPQDRLALWLRLRPPHACPVCGMACPDGAERAAHRGREECLCSGPCRAAFEATPDRFPTRPVERGRWAVRLRDAASGAPLLTIPIVLGGGEGDRAGHH